LSVKPGLDGTITSFLLKEGKGLRAKGGRRKTFLTQSSQRKTRRYRYGRDLFAKGGGRGGEVFKRKKKTGRNPLTGEGKMRRKKHGSAGVEKDTSTSMLGPGKVDGGKEKKEAVPPEPLVLKRNLIPKAYAQDCLQKSLFLRGEDELGDIKR